ncbi:MAG: choice-of-anchor tandem repeat NxxGxxAF-containing protein [Betaproteobacteria bacterium]
MSGVFGALCAADDTIPLRAIATSGMPIPGGGTFDRFHVEGQPAITPINDRGQVAFFATLARARASEGMFLYDGGKIEIIALTGSPAPGGGKLASFAAHPVPSLNRAGAVAFTASIAGGKASEGLFLSGNRRLRAIALSGSAAPGIPGGAFSDFQSPTLNDKGDIVVLASVRRGRDTLEAIYLYQAGKLRKIAAAGDAAPGGGNYVAFGVPTLNDKAEIAFPAVLDDGQVSGGIFIASGKQARMAVGAGKADPFGGIFSQFSDRIGINNASAILFNAVLKLGAVEQALLVALGDDVRAVAAVAASTPNDPTAPASHFSALGPWPSMSDDGAVAFIAAANDSSGTVSLYQAGPRQTRRRAEIGAPIASGGAIASFPLYPAVASSPNGAMAFAVVGEGSGESFEAILIAPPNAQ